MHKSIAVFNRVNFLYSVSVATFISLLQQDYSFMNLLPAQNVIFTLLKFLVWKLGVFLNSLSDDLCLCIVDVQFFLFWNDR